MKTFNLRVYALVINSKEEILLSDEQHSGRSFTKFPGGGLEWGEGTAETLKREFKEEFQLELAIGDLFYVNDFFQVSAFSENDQVLSFYYKATIDASCKVEELVGDTNQRLRWIPLRELETNNVYFPIDKKVVELLKNSLT